jgi:hypothetical protein
MTDLTLESREHFDLFYKPDRIVARIKAALDVESLELHTQDPEQKVRTLKREYELCNQDIDAYPRKEYLDFGKSDDRHYNIFLSHCNSLKGLIKKPIHPITLRNTPGKSYSC